MKVGVLMIGAALAACAAEPTPETEAAWTLAHTIDGELMGVWGSGPTDIWAVGGQTDQSLVLHGDGRGWTAVDVPSRSLLYAIYGFSDSDVYAVGEAGLILHFDGATWTRVESGTTRPLFGLWGASGDDVWIVGGDIAGPAGSAVVLRGSHGSFDVVDVPAGLAPNVLFKAHGSASGVIMVGADGTVLRFDGAEWRKDPVPTTEPLRSTWGRGEDDVYAVGGRGIGEILHFDGQAWNLVVELPSGSGLSGVFTSDDGPTLAVGGPGFVFEVGRDQSVVQATLPDVDPVPSLHGVWGDARGTSYAVGGGAIFRRR